MEMINHQEEWQVYGRDGGAQGLRWVALDDFEKMAQTPTDYKMVPYSAESYSLIVKALRHFV